MQFVGPALGDDADLPAAGAAELGRVGAAHDLDLFNGIDAGVLLDGGIRGPVHVIGAVHRPIVLALPRAVDRETDDVVTATGIRRADVDLIREIRGHTRLQRHQLSKMAVVEREFPHLRPRDQAGQLGRLQLHLKRRRYDSDLLVDAPDFEPEVGCVFRVRVQFDAVPGRFLETAGLDGHRVGSDRQQCGGIQAHFIGLEGAENEPLRGCRHRDPGISHGRAGRVHHCAGDVAGNFLRGKRA